MKITPVLLVDQIEKSLPFWVERMGFAKKVEVPDGDRLGFVILSRDNAELMLQTIASVRKDEPKFAPRGESSAASLFVEVDDFEDILRRLDGYPVAMAPRDTFYGMREIGVFEPGGHIIVFAAWLKKGS
ncbi:MAG: VOC family protein [Acidobacteriia bacterium]|nr:VOC family protein [Terriglobia bacterium]